VEKKKQNFDTLISIVERLRSPQGCPWDREQTMDTLKTFLIEEVYEVIEAIDEGDPAGLREELGDLLFHILFISHLAKEEGKFDIWEVIESVSRKMVERHPHVFGEKRISTSRQVEEAWFDLKKREKNQRRSVLEGIPRHLPALLRAYRITERASRVGFDWAEVDQIFEKLDEEIGELKKAISLGQEEMIHEELGDLLFVLVNIARLTGNNPEEALQGANRKFVARFHYIEKALERSHRSLKETTIQEMDRLWEEAKEKE